MSDYPAEWVEAAAEALHPLILSAGIGNFIDKHATARAVLDAALPLIENDLTLELGDEFDKGGISGLCDRIRQILREGRRK